MDIVPLLFPGDSTTHGDVVPVGLQQQSQAQAHVKVGWQLFQIKVYLP